MSATDVDVVLCAYLVAQASASFTLGTNLFAGPLPPEQPLEGLAAVMAVRSYPVGRTSEKRFGASALAWEWPRVQVLTRGAVDDIDSATTLAGIAYRLLGAIEVVPLGGVLVHQARCLQPPAFYRWDEDHRPEVVFNVEVEREVPAS